MLNMYTRYSFISAILAASNCSQQSEVHQLRQYSATQINSILCGNFKRAAMQYPCRLRLLSWWGALLAYYSLHRVVLKVIPYIFRIFGHSAPKLTIVGRYLSSSVILQRNCIQVVHHLEIVRVHCLLKHIN